MEEHDWTRYFKVDIMNTDGDDLELDIPNGKVLKKNYVGKHIQNYDSMLVLSHFKGHPMGKYGGACEIKQIYQNSNTDKPEAAIYYENGNVVIFNYLTGKLKTRQEKSTSNFFVKIGYIISNKI